MKKVSLSIVTLLLCFVCLFSVACGGPRGDSESVGGSSSGGGDSSVKYSLQGTTQGRYLTGGVPPVRFSM